MAKKVSIVVCVLLLTYFLFTSGMVFEESHSNAVGMIDLPYSIALSGERLSLVGIFNEDDVVCARWLVNRKPHLPIDADYNSFRLLMGNVDELEDLVVSKPKSEHYLFLSSWNVEHQTMVVGLLPALRGYTPLPALDKAVTVFQRGKAIVYYIQGGAK